MGFLRRGGGGGNWEAESAKQDAEQTEQEQEAKQGSVAIFRESASKLGSKEFYGFVNEYTRALAKRVDSGEVSPLEWLSAEGQEVVSKAVEDRAKDDKEYEKETARREAKTGRLRGEAVLEETLEERTKGLVVSMLEGAARGSDTYLEEAEDVIKMFNAEMLKDITVKLEQRAKEGVE